MSQTYSGFTAQTAENLLLDSGAFFANFDIASDTFESAVAAGKLIGATRGGGEFSATPEIRAIEIDGVKGKAKGLQVIDSWAVTITANVLEVTRDGLARALTASEIDTDSNLIYDIIKAKNYIELTDYITNITWIGKKSGTAEPVIIQVYNVINTSGITLTTQDKNEAVIAMTFEGHYDADQLDNPPFAIFYPKTTITAGTITGVVSNADGAVEGATVSPTGTTITTITNNQGVYVLIGVPAGEYTITATKGEETGSLAAVTVVAKQTTSGANILIEEEG